MFTFSCPCQFDDYLLVQRLLALYELIASYISSTYIQVPLFFVRRNDISILLKFGCNSLQAKRPKAERLPTNTELSMKVAQFGIIFILAFVECHHMEWLSEDSRLDECGFACHSA